MATCLLRSWRYSGPRSPAPWLGGSACPATPERDDAARLVRRRGRSPPPTASQRVESALGVGLGGCDRSPLVCRHGASTGIGSLGLGPELLALEGVEPPRRGPTRSD